MFAEENTDEVKRRLEENTNTMTKMTDLKQRLRQAASRKQVRGEGGGTVCGEVCERLKSRALQVMRETGVGVIWLEGTGLRLLRLVGE